MSSLTFPVSTAFVLSWTLADSAGNPINNATVTANLYSGRSLVNPDAVPGTIIEALSNFPLPYVTDSNGIYSATVAAFDPGDLGNFVLTIDATVLEGSVQTPIYHKEIAIVFETAGSPLDLTTVDLVKSWHPGFSDNPSTDDDDLIQLCITAWGYEWLNRTGTGDQNGDFQQSPFNAVCTFNEVYDGSDNTRLFLRNRPIRSIISLMVNGIQMQAAGPWPSSGYLIDGSARSISLRSAGIGVGPNGYSGILAGPYRALGGGLRFWKGQQNVVVQYTAGYSITPADIVQCANKVVALNYKRRPYTDEDSRAMAGGAGTTRFHTFDVPPECQKIIDRYTRMP